MQGPTRAESIGLWRRTTFPSVQLGTLTLLLLNAVGATFYVLRASPSWAIPEEHGVVPITGEPFVWFAGTLPVVAIFFVLNLAWVGLIVARRRWRSGRFCLLAALCWLIAVWVDFAHH
jgi:hypothetical protein